MPPDRINTESDALQQFKLTLNIPTTDIGQWLLMPRKYTRKSVRFSLPINTHDLAILTPFQYVSRHVWLSNYRKQLFSFVFNKYQVDPNDAGEAGKTNATAPVTNTALALADEVGNAFEKERTMEPKWLQAAMKDVLGFHGTDEKINDVWRLLQMNGNDDIITFRSWCGVVAFAERYLNDLSHEEDPPDEVRYNMVFIVIVKKKKQIDA